MKRILEEDKTASPSLPIEEAAAISAWPRVITLKTPYASRLSIAPFAEHWTCCIVNEKGEGLWQRFFYPRKEKTLQWGENKYNGILGAFYGANYRHPRDVEEMTLAYVMALMNNKCLVDGTLPPVLEEMDVRVAADLLKAVMQRDNALETMQEKHREEMAALRRELSKK